MPRGPMTPDELRRYAEMIVKGCIAFRRGDVLVQRVGLAHRELAVAVSEAAYRAGAAAVDVEYDDPRVYAARVRHGSQAAPGKRTSWQRERMRRRATRLTKLDLKEVHVRDDGTDLRLKIADYSMWRGGGERDHWGRQIAMNAPTEECFISPDAAATEGTFRCSRPRSFGGRVIENLSGEFRGGRPVRLRAKRDADRDWLARYLGAIPHAHRLREIALVDASSRVGHTRRSYYNRH